MPKVYLSKYYLVAFTAFCNIVTNYFYFLRPTT